MENVGEAGPPLQRPVTWVILFVRQHHQLQRSDIIIAPTDIFRLGEAPQLLQIISGGRDLAPAVDAGHQAIHPNLGSGLNGKFFHFGITFFQLISIFCFFL